MVLYQRGVNGREKDAPAERIRHMEAAGGCFAVPFELYEKGALGPTLWQRGYGAAERRLIECLRFDNECLERGVRYALQAWHPDLLFHYIPWIDTAGHTWMGALDPDSPRYDAALARKLWPYYASAYELQ